MSETRAEARVNLFESSQELDEFLDVADSSVEFEKLQKHIAELEAWKTEAMALQTDITNSRDESMSAEDKQRYLGRGTGFIIADTFRRAHEAEKGFLRHIQSENNCVFSRNGQPCRKKENCGCYLEMEEYLKREASS